MSRLIGRRELMAHASAAVAIALAGCRVRVEPLRLGLTAWPAYELYFLADNLGFYEGAGVRVVDAAAEEQALQAFRNSATELLPCTLDEAIGLLADLPDTRVVQVLDYSNGADVILAQPELRSLGDLRGRRVGYEATALGAYLLTRALDAGGLASGDIVAMPLHFDEHERAFAERRVDAVVTYEPARTRLLAAGARIVFDSSRIPQEIMDVLAVRESWIRSREDTLRAVVSGWLEVADALQTRPDVVTPALAHRLRLPAEEVVASFAGIELLGLAANRSLLGPPAGIVPVARRLADTMVAHGFLDHAPDVSALADATIVGGLPDGAPR